MHYMSFHDSYMQYPTNCMHALLSLTEPSLACLVFAGMAYNVQLQLYEVQMDKPTNALLCISFCRNTFVESSNLQTKMSWSKEFRSSGLQWTYRSAGGTSVISGGCYLVLSN